MSETASQDVAHRPRPGAVPLAVLIEFICQKVYTDLMRLVDLLPSKTDLEKKIEIATFFSRTRHLLIRLEALVKWSNSASKVDKCEKISNFLEEQSFFLINTANSLSRLLRETLIGARLPPFAVIPAIEIFTNKNYTRLPKSIKNCVSPLEPVSNRQLNQALLDLNRIIQNRLSLTQIPRQFKMIQLANGRVTFVVPHEFSVTMTLMSEAIDFPWRLLEIKFLVRDPVSRQPNLVHPSQVQFLLNRIQSRLLYRNFDKRPPLIHLYDMLHAFSISLQLDVLHELAQRARAKRPTDQFVVEAYKPGQSVVLSYWHALSHNQFHAQLGLDGKLQSVAYTLTVHVDPVESQRPLCVTHRPPLPDPTSHRIGAILQGDHLSVENLLARTITARAEEILRDLRQELMVLSPGPVRLADAPLCLYIPLLWPCHSLEYLQLRVDPIQGTLCVSCPFLLSSDHEQILPPGVTKPSYHGASNSTGYSRATISTALTNLEDALNRPSPRRTQPIGTDRDEVQSLAVVQSKSLRTLASTGQRWRTVLLQSMEHLRVCTAMIRVSRTARTHRPFWQSTKRTLPIVLTTTQVNLAVVNPTNSPASSAWASELVRFQQSALWPMLFIQLFPNNEYYLICEVVPSTGSLSISYRYWMLVCAALPDHMATTVAVNEAGLLVCNPHASSQLIPCGASPSGGHTGLFLHITHGVPLTAGSVWFHNPSTSLSLLKLFTEKARKNLLKKRTSRVAELLRKTSCHKSVDTSSMKKQALFKPASAVDTQQSTLPILSCLIGTLEENIMSNSLALELSRSGIVHDGVKHDGGGSLSAIQLFSLPSNPPSWQPSDLIPLSDHVHQIILRPHIDPFSHRRSWQMDLLFTGLQALPNPSTFKRRRPVPPSSIGCEDLPPASSFRLRHQTAEWSIVRLEDYGTVVRNVLAEWDSLCCMHALCHRVINNPTSHLPANVQLHSYNLKSLCLEYGSHYLFEISYRPDAGFLIAFGFTPKLFSPRSSVDSKPIPVSPIPDRVDSNPHMIIRPHLEELLNVTKSLTILAQVISHTLPFIRAVEPLRDRTLSINGLKFPILGNTLRPVRGMVLIAFSLQDLVLIYRGSLSLRITLTNAPTNQLHNHLLLAPLPSSDATSNKGGNMNATSKNGPKASLVPSTVHLADALDQLMIDGMNRGTDGANWAAQMGDSVLSNLVPLPAFPLFLSSIQEACQMDIEAESWTGLTVAQLSQLVRSPRTCSTSTDNTQTTARTSALESYLSSSLLFHACRAAITSLDVTILPASIDPTMPAPTPSSGEPDRDPASTAMRVGAFEARWAPSGLISHCCLVPQRTGVEVATWRLSLRLSTPRQAITAAPIDRWSPEALSLLEEFFAARACAPPYQPSAIAAYFRLLSLPMRVLRGIVCHILPLDLLQNGSGNVISMPSTPGALSAPVRLRLGLVGCCSMSGNRFANPTAVPSHNRGHSPHAALMDSVGGAELAPGLPAVVIRPPRVTLQLLVGRGSPRSGQVGSRVIGQPLAQPLPILYDWETNRVALAPPGATGGENPLILDPELENNANLMASSGTPESALVHLVSLLTQSR